MSDEWYVLSGSKVRGPVSTGRLRKAFAAGEIDAETPIRAGADGAWTFAREVPEFGGVIETAPPVRKKSPSPTDSAKSTTAPNNKANECPAPVADAPFTDGPDFTQVSATPTAAPQLSDHEAVLLGSTQVTEALTRRRSNRSPLSRSVLVSALTGGLIAAVLAATQFGRPGQGKSLAQAAIESAESEMEPTETAPPSATAPPVKAADLSQIAKPAGNSAANKSDNESSITDVSTPTPPAKVQEQAVKEAEKEEANSFPQAVGPKKKNKGGGFGHVALGGSDAAGGGGSPESATRDKFDIPWPAPSAPGDPISEHMNWEKLDNIMRDYKQLYDEWLQHYHQNQAILQRLNKIATNLQNLQIRAERKVQAMNKIRGVIGDTNADNAEIFAPIETPPWVQSLAKTYTIRRTELEALDEQTRNVFLNLQTALTDLDNNITESNKICQRREELRSEWVRITRPFAFRTRQDFPVAADMSGGWILNNDIFAPAWLARAIAEIREKNYDKAREDIAAAVLRDQQWVELSALQQVLEDRAGKRVDADKTARWIRHLLVKKKRPAFLDVCEGLIAERHHNFDNARGKFVAATKDDPTDPTGKAELALLLISHPNPQKRDPAGAVEAATTACKATKWNHWFFLDVLARAYATGGDFERAVACTNRAKQAAPNDVQSLLDERIASYKNSQVPAATVGEL